METSFLECAKVILNKVSSDQRLMLKEYGKLCNLLNEQEKMKLDIWLVNKKKRFFFSPIPQLRAIDQELLDMKAFV